MKNDSYGVRRHLFCTKPKPLIFKNYSNNINLLKPEKTRKLSRSAEGEGRIINKNLEPRAEVGARVSRLRRMAHGTHSGNTVFLHKILTERVWQVVRYRSNELSYVDGLPCSSKTKTNIILTVEVLILRSHDCKP